MVVKLLLITFYFLSQYIILSFNNLNISFTLALIHFSFTRFISNSMAHNVGTVH